MPYPLVHHVLPIDGHATDISAIPLDGSTLLRNLRRAVESENAAWTSSLVYAAMVYYPRFMSQVRAECDRSHRQDVRAAFNEGVAAGQFAQLVAAQHAAENPPLTHR